MEVPEPRYATTADGTHIAYTVMGDGPIDLVYAFGYLSNIDADGEVPFHAAFRQRLASFFRLIVFDRRGTGLSDRSGIGEAGSLDEGMDDIRAVMDAVGSERALLFGLTDGGMLCALFAASHPDRSIGLVLWAASPRGKRSADYPWGWTDEEWASRFECAQAISEAVRPLGMEVRAGLHAGEVETIDGKLGGIAVHIGARVGALAEPSEVLVSRTVKDLVVGSGLSFEDAGEHELKGIPDRWQLYRLVSGA